MKDKKMNKKSLVTHIKRLQGQLNAVVSELEKESTDCLKASNTLFAATRSIASLKQEFVHCFLDNEFLGKNKVDNKKLGALLNLIK